MNFTCQYCSKSYTTSGSKNRHEKVCNTKEVLEKKDDVVINLINNLTKRLSLMESEMKKHDDEMKKLKQENQELRSQMQHLSCVSPQQINNGTINNTQNNINIHIQVNNITTIPRNFGEEDTEHITLRKLKWILDRYGNTGRIEKIVNLIYRDPKVPDNHTIIMCTCGDVNCKRIVIRVPNAWKEEVLDLNILKIIIQRLIDAISNVPNIEYTGKVDEFDRYLCDVSNTKNFPIESVKIGLLSDKTLKNK